MWFFGKKAKKIKEEPKLERQIRLTGQTHTVEDEVLELAYDIDTAFKQVRSHAGEVELVSVYAPDKEHGSEADEPYVAIQDDDVPYCAIDEYNENGTVKDAIELTPLEGKFLFKAKMDYFKELMYFYAFERAEDVFNQAGLCVVYPKSMQGTEDEKELMQLLDRVAESFRSI